MAKASVTGVSSVDLGVADPAASARFYANIWGLAPVAETADAVYLRATGPAHHVLALHRRAKTELLRITLSAPDKAAVEALHGALADSGVAAIEKPAAIAEPGGGYGFAFKDLEGRTLRILAGDERHRDTADDPDRPRKIAHVVLNTRDAAAARDFYTGLLGFKLSDRTRMMTFIRANTDHHCIAFVDSDRSSLHHIAFEMRDLDAVMRGAGRMKDNNVPLGWGVGRHGPGHNVFAYFIDPNEVIIEYTAEVEQVDESYKVGGPEDWGWPPGRMDHWGIATGPTERMKAAHDRHIGFGLEIFHPAR